MKKIEITYMLKDNEIKFLNKLSSSEYFLMKDNKPSEKIQEMIDRGYCKTSPLRIGPLGIYTGEIGLSITEAGKLALSNHSVN